jgi:hypothetical protein
MHEEKTRGRNFSKLNLRHKLLRHPLLVFVGGVIVGLGIPYLLVKPIESFIFKQLVSVETKSKQQLSLPNNLISLISSKGQKLLIESNSKEDYWHLSPQFLTQKSQSFCGVATMVMVLNAMKIPAPEASEHYPFHVFTQDNFFNSKARAVIAPEIVYFVGLTLEQIGQLLETYGVRAKVYHSTDTNLDRFRTLARKNLQASDNFIIVNYFRQNLNQQSGGHISTLAAYNEKSDCFLILDVSRYKYPPIWVKASDLWKAMNTFDPFSKKTKGFVVVSKK